MRAVTRSTCKWDKYAQGVATARTAMRQVVACHPRHVLLEDAFVFRETHEGFPGSGFVKFGYWRIRQNGNRYRRKKFFFVIHNLKNSSTNCRCCEWSIGSILTKSRPCQWSIGFISLIHWILYKWRYKTFNIVRSRKLLKTSNCWARSRIDVLFSVTLVYTLVVLMPNFTLCW